MNSANTKCDSCTISYKCSKHPSQPSSRQLQIKLIEDAVAEIINHPLTPKLDENASIRFVNIINRHLARYV